MFCTYLSPLRSGGDAAYGRLGNSWDGGRRMATFECGWAEADIHRPTTLGRLENAALGGDTNEVDIVEGP